MRKISVVIADDHPMLVMANRLVIAECPGLTCVGDARNSTELIELLDVVECDVLITDYSMPGGSYGDGLALLSLLGRRYPAIKPVVLTVMDNPAVVRAMLQAGVRRIVSKSDDANSLRAAIQAAVAGGPFLSPSLAERLRTGPARVSAERCLPELSHRELEVLRLFAASMTVSEIAAHLRRSKQTISTQKASVMRKLGIDRDTDLVRYAIEMGLAPAGGG